eukprot:392759-Alexandrium_andersonii.AAC.1
MPAARVRVPAQAGAVPVPMEGAGLPVAGAGHPNISGIPPPMTPPAVNAAMAPAVLPGAPLAQPPATMD